MIKWLLISLLFIGTSVCAQDFTLEEALRFERVEQSELPEKLSSRETTVVFEAKKVGIAGGYAEYRQSIIYALRKHSRRLDTIYDFTHVLVRTDDGSLVLPPVVEEFGPQTQVIDGGKALREIDARLVIQKPAKLIAQIPSWRQYLAIPAHSGQKMDRRGWPKNDPEKQIWKSAVKEAWARGRDQAADLYELRFSKLEAEYVGMLRYVEYVNRNMLREIYVAGNELGTATNGDKTSMQVGGRFVRITRPAQFDGDPKNWTPVSIPIDWEVFDERSR